MKRIALLIALLIPTISYAQATRDVQKKASRQTANVETLGSDKTLTYLDAETQLLTPNGANRIVTLPSTNVWKAWTVKIVNEGGANSLTIKSSDGTTLDTLPAVGQVQYVARQATPTGSAHWTNISKIGTLGVTDGSSACTGCVGETLTFTQSGSSPISVSGTYTGWSFTLPSGSWLLLGSQGFYNAAATVGNFSSGLSTSSTAINLGQFNCTHAGNGAGISCAFYGFRSQGGTLYVTSTAYCESYSSANFNVGTVTAIRSR